MRKLAFRAWDKENNRMETTFEVTSQGVIKFTPLGMTTKYLEHFILMQFTGMKDKNGKEIYESDLLMCEEGIRYKLEWEEQYGGYRLYFWGGKDWDWDEQIDDMYDYQTKRISLEIIGNLYENPELLK